MLNNKLSLMTLALWAALAAVPKPSEATQDKALLLGQSPSPSFSVPDSLPKGTTVKVDGSSSLEAINQNLKQKFEQKYPDSTLATQYSGTDAALAALREGKIDLAAIGRNLTDAERQGGLSAYGLPRQKIAIITGPENAFKGSITFEQFAKIFRGEITDWSQLGGTPGPIRFIDRPEDSDTRRAFQNYEVFRKSSFATGENAVRVKEDSTAEVIRELGKDGISYAIANQVLDRTDVSILPMHKVLPDNPSYPFSQPIAYVYKGTTPSAALSSFLGYATSSPGQEAIAQTQVENAAATGTTVTSARLATVETTTPATLTAQQPASEENGASPNSASPADSPAGTANPDAGTSSRFPWVWLLAPLGLLGLLLWWLKEKDSEPEPRLEPTTAPPSGTALPPATPTEPVNPTPPVATAGTINPPPATSDSIGSDAPKTIIDNSTVIQPAEVGAVAAPPATAETPLPPTETSAGFPSEPDWEGTPPEAAGESPGVAPDSTTPIPAPESESATPFADAAASSGFPDGGTAAVIGGAAAAGAAAAAVWGSREDDEATIPTVQGELETPIPASDSEGAADWTDAPTMPPVEETQTLETRPSDPWQDAPTMPPPEASEIPSEEGGDALIPATDSNLSGESGQDAPTMPPSEASEIPSEEGGDALIPATDGNLSWESGQDSPTMPPPEASEIPLEEGGDALIPATDSNLSGENEQDAPTRAEGTAGEAESSDSADWETAAAIGAAAAAGTAAVWPHRDDEPETLSEPSAEAADGNALSSLWEQDEESGVTAVGVGESEGELGEGSTQRIFLVPQDVHSAYAYWELPEAEKERLRDAGGQQMGLRLCDVTGTDPEGQDPHSCQHYDCTEATQYWNFHVAESDRDYLVELGYLTEDGQWLLAARSHPVHIPNSQAQFAPADSAESQSETMGMAALADDFSSSVRAMSIPTATAPGSEAMTAEVLLPPPGELWAIANVVASVQGVTVPGATVMVDGQRVEVNPDGTFDFPLDLSEGAIDRPILVESTDGSETRLLQVQFHSRSPFEA